MSTVITESPVIQSYYIIEPAKPLPKTNVYTDRAEQYVKQLIDQVEPICSNHQIDHRDAPVVVYLGPQTSSLKAAISLHLETEDVTLFFFSLAKTLWQWLNYNPSRTVVSLVLQPFINCQEVIAQSHRYASVRSILVRCETNEVIHLQRFARSYNKVDGIFDEDTRVLIKLVFDITLFSEEIGDLEREENNNELEAQRHYDRALKLCALVKKL